MAGVSELRAQRHLRWDLLEQAPVCESPRFDMKISPLVLAGLALIALSVRFDSRRQTEKVEALLAGRDCLTPEQFYLKYFKDRGISLQVALGIRSILEQELSADMSRLADTDDFSKNLAFFWSFDSMADVEIVCALEKTFGIKIEDQEAERACTISDLMLLVQSKVSEKEAKND